MNDDEEWRYVPNFPEYIVSNRGEIRRTGSGQGRHPSLRLNDNGDLVVNLRAPNDHQAYTFKVERIVAAAFMGGLTKEFLSGNLVHIDGDPANCRVDNLMWDDDLDHTPPSERPKDPPRRNPPSRGW